MSRHLVLAPAALPDDGAAVLRALALFVAAYVALGEFVALVLAGARAPVAGQIPGPIAIPSGWNPGSG